MAAKNILRPAVLLLAAAVAITLGQHYWTVGRWQESTDNAYVRADIHNLSARVAGEVVAVLVKENQPVRKGEVLLRIDTRDYEAKLLNAKAMVAQAEAALLSNVRTQSMQAAMVDEARANLTVAQADRGRVRKDYDRARALVKDGVATAARLDVASAAARSAEASVTRGAAGVKVARSQGETLLAEQARLAAQLDAMRANEQLATLDLEATTLRAPVDGRVGNLAVKLGERINPNLRLVSLVADKTVWVEANFKETQLTRMAIGQPARVHVDAFPDAEIEARIESLAPASGAEFALLPPDNATGNFTKIVQRVPVKLALQLSPEQAAQLRPGMSVEAHINTKPDA